MIVEDIKPFKDQPGTRKEQVKLMFGKIAGRYDFMNHLLSFNRDKAWRSRLVARAVRDYESTGLSFKQAEILDAATGTGDLAIGFALKGPGKVTGIDLSPDMLFLAGKKAEKSGLKIYFREEDGECLSFAENSFDIVSISFGIRNFSNPEKGISEFHRVLKPGGYLYVLEFSKPPNRIIRGLNRFYSGTVLPLTARILRADPKAYQYLPDTVSAFPSGEEFVKLAAGCGFKKAGIRYFTLGVVAMYSFVKLKRE